MRTIKQRFLAKIRIDSATGCWNWTASQNGKGYGQFNVDGAPLGAHRVSFELHKGIIPDGLFVCHHCDNRACVNPDHLFLGSAADNASDRDAKERLIVFAGEDHGSAKLTDADVIAIRASREPQKVLADRYGVSGSQISRVRTGKQRLGASNVGGK